MEKVLITGADGFLGRNFVSAMLSSNKEVYAIVYPGNDVYKDKKEEKLHVKYIDLNRGMEHIKDFPVDIDVMYHFAWIGVDPETRNDLDKQILNINMSLECMKLAAALGIKRIIFPGSTNEYLYYGKPINKDVIPSPHNTYGAVKIAVRYLCGDFAERNNMEFIYAIITGIYASDRRDNNVIFYTIDKLLHKEKPLLTKLEQLWDYVYIDDEKGVIETLKESCLCDWAW